MNEFHLIVPYIKIRRAHAASKTDFERKIKGSALEIRESFSSSIQFATISKAIGGLEKLLLFGKFPGKKQLIFNSIHRKVESIIAPIFQGIVIDAAFFRNLVFLFTKDGKIWLSLKDNYEAPFKLDVGFSRYYCASILISARTVSQQWAHCHNSSKPHVVHRSIRAAGLHQA